MKMPNGGFNPAVNVQLATDTESRAILGVQVTSEGSDSAGVPTDRSSSVGWSAGLSQPMRQQVEQRSGGQVEQHLLDGGYLRTADIEQAQADGVELFMPPKTAKSPKNRGRELEPKPGDSEAVLVTASERSAAQSKACPELAEGDPRLLFCDQPFTASLRCLR